MFALQRPSEFVITTYRTSALVLVRSIVRDPLTYFQGTPVRWVGHTISLQLVEAVPDEQLVALQGVRQPVAAEQAELLAAGLNELPAAGSNELQVVAQAEMRAVQNVQPQEECESLPVAVQDVQRLAAADSAWRLVGIVSAMLASSTGSALRVARSGSLAGPAGFAATARVLEHLACHLTAAAAGR